jgi:hypothetical protein
MRKAQVVLALVVLAQANARAHPYRLITARSARQTAPGDFELGLRYQGLLDGDGLGGLEPEGFHQVAASLRVGVVDRLELEAEASFIVFHDAGSRSASVEPGDVKLGAQVQLLRAGPSLLGIYLGFTLPTGPSDIDVLPPFFADGTFDFEGLLLYEAAPGGGPVRLVFDAGYIVDGTRERPELPGGSFDVPNAFRYDAAIAVSATPRLQLSLELNGRYYSDPVITPVWRDDQHILEVTPGLRFEPSPGFVLEAGAGIALNDDTRRIYKVRALAGLTYELSTRRHTR